MPVINYASREIDFKIVFSGPSGSGKKTTLEVIRRKAAPSHELQMAASGPDTVASLELKVRGLTLLDGFVTKLQLHTITGPVQSAISQRHLLRDLDGVVFVADSQWDRMESNVQEMERLDDDLQREGLGVGSVPLVFQWNKRDLENIAPVDYMDFTLNQMEQRAPALETTSKEGAGVLETLDAITALILNQFISDNDSAPAPAVTSQTA
jgi:mutual gliding-motility protein MglA